MLARLQHIHKMIKAVSRLPKPNDTLGDPDDLQNSGWLVICNAELRMKGRHLGKGGLVAVPEEADGYRRPVKNSFALCEYRIASTITPKMMPPIADVRELSVRANVV